jgi:iron complex transport system ATP-binding protein
MEIEHLEKRDVTSLSSGERQKTMIARLLAGETPILLLDEPLASLDIGSSLKLLSLLRKKAQNGATICLTIHDLPLAYRFVDHILCLSHGELVADGPAKEVLLSPLVRQAFGVEPSIETGLVLNTFP